MSKKKLVIGAISAVALIALAPQAATASTRVEAVAIVHKICPLTVVGVAVCTGVGTLLSEGVQAANGKRPFGKNGEGARALRSILRGLGWKKA